MKETPFFFVLLLFFVSSLEAQTMARTNEKRIVEIRLQPSLDSINNPANPNGLNGPNGLLRVTLRLSGLPSLPLRISAGLKQGSGLASPSLKKDLPINDSTLSFFFSVPRPKLWSAETPNLYFLSVRLLDSGGRVLDSALLHTGFRNGRPEPLKGIALALSRKTLLSDLRLLKQFNINTVRIDSAPEEEWYDLCDQYGMYVVEAADPSSAGPARAFVHRHEHPSILIAPPTLPGDSSDSIFSSAMLFTAGGTAYPSAWEIKKRYEPILTRLLRPAIIRVSNEHSFRDLSAFRLEWELTAGGISRQRGSVESLSLVGPRQSKNFQLPLHLPPATTEEWILHLRYRLKKAEGLLPAGYPVASAQFLLKKAAVYETGVNTHGELSFTDEGGVFTISSPAIRLQFNKQTGWLQHYEVKGISLLEDTSGLRCNFWRPAGEAALAPARRDPSTEGPGSGDTWRSVSAAPRLQLFSTSTSSELVMVRADYELPGVACFLHIRYTINAGGEMQVEQTLDADSTQKGPPLPRYGMQWILPPGFDSVTYYGRGPQENYSGRNDYAETGLYRQTVNEQYFPYPHPRETGMKTDVRWWKITNGQGRGLLVNADSSLLCMSALHYFDSDLDGEEIKGQQRTTELVPRPQTQLNIDYRQTDRLPYGNYRYAYKITPL